MGGGLKSIMEETCHVFEFAALERGYNIILYEGTGHATIVQGQKNSLIVAWTKVVSSIVDYLYAHRANELSLSDTSKLCSHDMRLGGHLLGKVAAFEPRPAAVICIDVVWSFYDTFTRAFPTPAQLGERGNEQAFDELFEKTKTSASMNGCWINNDPKHRFCELKAYKCVERAQNMTLEGIADKIKMPAFIGDAHRR